MLVLTRKRTETIRIGDDVTIRVIRTGPSTVKIGIEAPADVRILRGELCGGAKPPAETEAPGEADEDDDASVLEWKPNGRQRMHSGLADSDQFPHPHIASLA